MGSSYMYMYMWVGNLVLLNLAYLGGGLWFSISMYKTFNFIIMIVFLWMMQDQLVKELHEHQEKLNKLMAQNDQFSSTNVIN